MKIINYLALFITVALLQECTSCPGDGGTPTPTPYPGSCDPYYTCGGNPNQYQCNPNSPLNACPGDLKCQYAGCSPQTSTAPQQGSGLKITFSSTDAQGAEISIQRYNHQPDANGYHQPIGDPVKTRIAPNQPPNEVTKKFCNFSTSVGISCVAEGKVAKWSNEGLDIVNFNPDITESIEGLR